MLSPLEMGEMLVWARAQGKAGGCQSSQEELDIVRGADGVTATEG